MRLQPQKVHLSSIIYHLFIYHLFIYTAGLFFSALRTGCVHLTARLVNNCRKYSAKRAAIKSHVWAHPLRPPNGASWDFIASCDISFFVRLRTGDRGCTNRKTGCRAGICCTQFDAKKRSLMERISPSAWVFDYFFFWLTKRSIYHLCRRQDIHYSLLIIHWININF